jgi:hypothetical protein
MSVSRALLLVPAFLLETPVPDSSTKAFITLTNSGLRAAQN